MIYILSIYGEYGAERVKATTDKSAVVDMLRSYSNERVFPNMRVLWERGLLTLRVMR